MRSTARDGVKASPKTFTVKARLRGETISASGPNWPRNALSRWIAWGSPQRIRRKFNLAMGKSSSSFSSAKPGLGMGEL
jgi:hypothetical protein